MVGYAAFAANPPYITCVDAPGAMNFGTIGARSFIWTTVSAKPHKYRPGRLFSRGTENTDYRVKQAVESPVVQYADLRHEQFLMGREQFAGPRVADDSEGALFEVGIREPHGLRVGIWTAGYLTQNPVTATDICKHDGGAQLALGEIGKRERNKDYRTD